MNEDTLEALAILDSILAMNDLDMDVDDKIRQAMKLIDPSHPEA